MLIYCKFINYISQNIEKQAKSCNKLLHICLFFNIFSIFFRYSERQLFFLVPLCGTSFFIFNYNSIVFHFLFYFITSI